MFYKIIVNTAITIVFFLIHPILGWINIVAIMIEIITSFVKEKFYCTKEHVEPATVYGDNDRIGWVDYSEKVID